MTLYKNAVVGVQKCLSLYTETNDPQKLITRWYTLHAKFLYSPDIPARSMDCTIYIPGIGTLFYRLISSQGNSVFAHFTAAIANHYNLAFSFHQVPITAG